MLQQLRRVQVDGEAKVVEPGDETSCELGLITPIELVSTEA